MAAYVSYELFASRIASANSGFTAEGGLYVSYINDTGAISKKGTIVSASTDFDNAVGLTLASSNMPIGIIYEDGIADGSEVKVVISGKAQVLLKDTLSATRGYWCGVSDTDGRMYQASAVPIDTESYKTVGHCMQNINAGADVLAWVNLQFN